MFSTAQVSHNFKKFETAVAESNMSALLFVWPHSVINSTLCLIV